MDRIALAKGFENLTVVDRFVASHSLPFISWLLSHLQDHVYDIPEPHLELEDAKLH